MDLSVMTFWILVLGWGLNLTTTLVSILNDVYWGNQEISKGLIACLAFSWLPYLVFFAGLKHFIFWAVGTNGP